MLARYPYLFRKDFLPFENLPIQFYPYDDNGVLPFHKAEERFDKYTNIKEPIIRHNFFKDLEKPVLAADIFSQYELEYLRDNVRRSDWVARENHIYLHYASWGEFCAWLQILDVKPLLVDEKLVFLIDEEIEQYPIDFKARFGIDYSQYTVKPIGIREVNKIIWHTQFHTHNGGDFFNEILHGHPNLFAGDSIIFDDHMDVVDTLKNTAQEIIDSHGALEWAEGRKKEFGEVLLYELQSLKQVTRKDAFVTIYLARETFSGHLSPSERIVPAVMFQPHFYRTNFQWDVHGSDGMSLRANCCDDVRDSGLMQQFKYIKTFTPLRRPTTSHAASVRFMKGQADMGRSYDDSDDKSVIVIGEEVTKRFMNRTFMINPGERLFTDSRLVRFEDAKLNPTAVFRALAAFLDIPYTETMTYCSGVNGRIEDGFRTGSVYATYEEFCDQYERRLIEYMLRDVYEKYGYGFEQYDGNLITKEELEELLGKCNCNLEWIEKSWWMRRKELGEKHKVEGEELDKKIRKLVEIDLANHREKRSLSIRILQCGLPFVDKDGAPLKFMKSLELDPALLEQPLYH